MNKTLLAPAVVFAKINEFKKLHLGGKEVACPYFMNLKKQRAGLRVLIGKGDATEIEAEVKVWAKVKGFDLNKASPVQIREFMVNRSIGSDCSGFVTHILNAWLKSQKAQLLLTYLQFPKNDLLSRLRRFLRPVENIGANLLTSELNTNKIEDLDSIQPGDLIRSKGLNKNAHHVLLITKVVKEQEVVKEFEYIHSTRHYGQNNGVKIGRVEITNVNKELKDQRWLEEENGKNYTWEGLLNNYQDNGLRRLKWVNLDYQLAESK